MGTLRLQEGESRRNGRVDEEFSIFGRGEVIIACSATEAKLRISRQNCVPISTILSANAKLVTNEDEYVAPSRRLLAGNSNCLHSFSS